MASTWVWAVVATLGVAFVNVPAALSQSPGDGAPQGYLYFPPYMPGGHAYAPGEESLPAINSAEAHFNTRVDILQTEIYRRNYDQRMFESEMNRHDLRGGPLNGPSY